MYYSTPKQIFKVHWRPAGFSLWMPLLHTEVGALHFLPPNLSQVSWYNGIGTGITQAWSSCSSAMMSCVSTIISPGICSLEYESVHEVICAVQGFTEGAQSDIQLSLAGKCFYSSTAMTSGAAIVKRTSQYTLSKW